MPKGTAFEVHRQGVDPSQIPALDTHTFDVGRKRKQNLIALGLGFVNLGHESPKQYYKNIKDIDIEYVYDPRKSHSS